MFGQPANTFGVQNGDSPVANARAMNSTGGKKVDLASYGIVTAPESHGHAGTRNGEREDRDRDESELRGCVSFRSPRVVASYWKIQS